MAKAGLDRAGLSAVQGAQLRTPSLDGLGIYRMVRLQSIESIESMALLTLNVHRVMR